jgi:hypothetical protein
MSRMPGMLCGEDVPTERLKMKSPAVLAECSSSSFLFALDDEVPSRRSLKSSFAMSRPSSFVQAFGKCFCCRL